jgi:hypothetical protein
MSSKDLDIGALTRDLQKWQAGAIENGWNVELKMTPEDGSPTIIIAIVQNESLGSWVGLGDTDDDSEEDE